MAEWREATLGELCAQGGGSIQTGPFGSQLHASDYVVNGIPSVMPQNIGDNRIIADGIARITAEDAARLAKYLLEPGDIVYSRRGDVEKRALVRADQAGWLCGTGCLRVRLGDAHKTDPRFISYLLGDPEVRQWVVRHAVGATMPNLNTTILSSLPLSVPALEEQRAIAEVLGALDDKIAANAKQASLADAAAVLEFRRSVSDVPMSAQTFDEVARVGGGGTPSTKVAEYWDGPIPWASPTDITKLQGPYLGQTARTISDLGLANCASSLYPRGSILMTSRATIGAFALAECPVAVNQGFIVVVPNDPLMRFWLFHEMRDRVDEFLTHANGATFLELSRGNFRRLPVRIADLAVITAFADKAAALHSSAASALRETRTLEAIRDALLPALMSGRLRVRDAERIVEEVV